MGKNKAPKLLGDPSALIGYIWAQYGHKPFTMDHVYAVACRMTSMNVGSRRMQICRMAIKSYAYDNPTVLVQEGKDIDGDSLWVFKSPPVW